MMAKSYPGKGRKEFLSLHELSSIKCSTTRQLVRGDGSWCYEGTALLDVYQQSHDI